MKKNLFLTIHGHFYQPPRGNPWLDIIEEQPDAAPDHDWNEKIYHECYKPNATARILNHELFIEEIINNFNFLSFNIGPTLLLWLREQYPRILEKIQEADRRSLEKHNGHGNALAQVYNHIIMPLALSRDQQTQVAWGLHAFEDFFSRKPEGMWLAETAVNYEVIDTLIDYGIRFTILSPYQALKRRPLDGSSSWKELKPGAIPSHKPYRIFSRARPEKYIDVFFYNPHIAQKFAFSDDIFTDAHHLNRELKAAAPSSLSQPSLLNIAVDGETFGHHKPFADMCLAFFFKKVNKDFHITNYGEFLDLFPPDEEAELYQGEYDKGSSWSCPHGVGRWERDCGCRADPSYEGDQRWRQSLRRCMNELNEHLWEDYSNFTAGHEADPLQVRNDYIPMRMSPGETGRKKALLEKHFPRIASDEENKLFSLLEAQYYSQLMFTSCGWFFDDIGRIEPVYNLRYALKAAEESARWLPFDYKAVFQKNLASEYSHYLKMKAQPLLDKMVFSASLSPGQIAGAVPLQHYADRTGTKLLQSGLFRQAEIIENITSSSSLEGKKGLLFKLLHRLTGETNRYLTLLRWNCQNLFFSLFVTEVEEENQSRVSNILKAFEEKDEESAETLKEAFPKGKFLELHDIPGEFLYTFICTIMTDYMANQLQAPEDYIQYLAKCRQKFEKTRLEIGITDKKYVLSFLQANLFALLKKHTLSLSLFNSALESLAVLEISAGEEIIQCCFKELFSRHADHFATLSGKKLEELVRTLQLMKKARINVQQTALQDTFFEYIRNYEQKYRQTPVYHLKESNCIQRIELLIELASLLSIAVPELQKIHQKITR